MLGKVGVNRMILADMFRVPNIASDYPDQWDNPEFYKVSIWLTLPDPGQGKQQPQNADRRLTTDETTALRNRIADLLSDPNCLPFINELLGKTAEQNKNNPPF